MGDMDRQLSQRQKIRSALERIGDIEVEFEENGRIDRVEKDTARLYMGFDKMAKESMEKIQGLASLVEAAVELLGGADIIDEKMKEIRERKALAAVANAKAAIEKGLKEGEIVGNTGAITEKSIIVGHELNAEGKTEFPGFVSLATQQLKPEFKNQLIGKTAPVTIDTANGAKLAVTAVYETVAKPAEQKPAEQKAEG